MTGDQPVATIRKKNLPSSNHHKASNFFVFSENKRAIIIYLDFFWNSFHGGDC